MSDRPAIQFAKLGTPKAKTVFVLVGEGGALAESIRAVDPDGALARAFAVADFSGKAGTSLDLITPAGIGFDRVVAVGVGNPAGFDRQVWMKFGGTIASLLRKGKDAAILMDVRDATVSGIDAADFAAGMLLRSYVFDRYKSGRSDADAAQKRQAKVTIHLDAAFAARKAFADAVAVVDGVDLARDLVNEPANVLGPVELAERAKTLETLGVKIEVLGEKELRKLDMGALLGVAQGSVRPPRLVVMQWNGGKPKAKPIAFVGKGVVFDTGGNSMKPASGMEDMKGDMGGAAAVVGLMRALAARKAKANVVGVIGCVENMVDGNAQRPGDIVTSKAGITIEVLNTDAEGRLVLADALTYTGERFKPAFMVNLATLTGAIMVALGQYHAGLFANDDQLAERLVAAGAATQERLWRMPLGADYDKLIDSKNADIKNIGGRYGGAITAAQFLQRFVKDTPWAHLDIAGTAMGAPSSEINQSWGSGYGVRLLDRLVRDNYES